jgi:hypothetical protein
MRSRVQLIAILALATITPAVAAQGGVSVGGFETRGSVGLDREDYDALGRALAAMLSARLGEQGGSRVVSIPPAAEAGRLDVGAAREAASRAGASVLVVGSLLDQYGDIQVEARLIDATSGKPIAVVRGDPAYVKREQLAEAISALAGELSRQPGVGGRAGAAGSGVPIEAMLQFGRGLQAEAAGNRTAAAEGFRAALRVAPNFSEARSALQRVGG